jgi:multidrug resistance efflux pump
MTWLRKMRPVLIGLGVVLAIGSLVGARALTHGSGDPSAKAADAGPRQASGLYVVGFVDSKSPVVEYRLPSVLQSGTVSKVYVKDGDEVKADQPLYEFDTKVQNADLVRATAGVATVRTKVAEADQAVEEHAQQIKFAEQVKAFAEEKVKLAFAYYTFVDKKLEESYKANGTKDPKEIEELKKSSLDLYKAKVDWAIAVNDQSVAKLKVEQLQKINPKVKVDEAVAAVKQAEAEQAKAQLAVDLCVVKAKTDGTVEQITIGPGTTLGIGTRAPALSLIPSGVRVVRAEVEGEFAHRVGPDLKGKTVIIYDHTDAKLTYTGTVTRVGTTFLAKRSNPDSFLGNDTRVLEVLIEVTDPAPPGKPPLYVGKRVRVNLGQ